MDGWMDVDEHIDECLSEQMNEKIFCEIKGDKNKQ